MAAAALEVEDEAADDVALAAVAEAEEDELVVEGKETLFASSVPQFAFRLFVQTACAAWSPTPAAIQLA